MKNVIYLLNFLIDMRSKRFTYITRYETILNEGFKVVFLEF